jgi:VanZ family protein
LLKLFPHLSPEVLDDIHLAIRKSAHLTEYGVLGALLWLALRASAHAPGRADWRRAGIAVLIATCYAASDEFHQVFVPSRGASVHDVLIDACGASVVILAVTLLNRGRERRTSR